MKDLSNMKEGKEKKEEDPPIHIGGECSRRGATKESDGLDE